MAINPTDSTFIYQVCSNTKTDFIEITGDKLEIILMKYLKDLKDSSGWLTPLSLFLAILIALLTSSFKDFLTISKDIWLAVFYLSLFISFVWLLYKVYLNIKNKKKIKIDFLIKTIKNN